MVGMPKRYREEFEGVAAGSGVSLQRIAESYYAERCAEPACSGGDGPAASTGDWRQIEWPWD